MKEYRILFIRRDRVGLRDLDSSDRFCCRVSGVRRYVEGEIVQFGPSFPADLRGFPADLRGFPADLGGSPADLNCPRPIVSSRIDPGYAPGEWPGLDTYTLPEHDPTYAPYFGLRPSVAPEVEEKFYCRAASSVHVKPASRVRICRGIIEKDPLFIDPYRVLGQVEWNRGRRDKARKYLETGWKIAGLAFPPGFTGTFDGRNGQNVPVFWVGMEYAKVLTDCGREDEALEILEFLARIDRPGGWSSDGIDLPILLRAGRIAHVARVVEQDANLGSGEFIRALLLFEDGRDEDAIRAVICGLISNPLLLDALLEPWNGKKRLTVPLQDGRDRFAYLAALHASLTLAAWRERGMLPRLKALKVLPDFSRALERAVELARGHDLRTGAILLRTPWEEFEECFPDPVIEATVRAGVGG